MKVSVTTKKESMKTPISYYGGKQAMLKHILPLIPVHQIYVEPFFGGGAVFWAKEKSKVEIINDYNANVVNFYYQLKHNFYKLQKLIDATPYSRETYKYALTIYNTAYLFQPIHRAWAFWVCTIQGFSNGIGAWRASQPRNKEALLNYNKRKMLTPEYSERLELVQIEQTDAIKVINRMDSSETFFYLDPPYVGADQGHYGGYTQEHFNGLLDTLSQIKGKFLLSSYPNTTLAEYRKEFRWYSSDKLMQLSASNRANRIKTEALTSNYKI